MGASTLSYAASYTIRNQEQTDDEERTEHENSQQQLRFSATLPSSSTQHTLNHSFFLLEELALKNSNESEGFLSNASIPFGEALRLFFWKIISPNAP